MTDAFETLRRVQVAAVFQKCIFDGACLSRLNQLCEEADAAMAPGLHPDGKLDPACRRLIDAMIASAHARGSRIITVADLESACAVAGYPWPFVNGVAKH